MWGSSKRSSSKHDRNAGGGFVKGAIAGAVGVWIMDLVTWGMFLREDPGTRQQEHAARIEGKDVAHVAAVKLARLTGTTLTPEQPHPLGLVIHYALGVLPGALYGVYRHRVPGLGAARGLLFGFGLFVVNDEIAGPLLGLASGPMAYPWQAHARGLVGHVVFGATTDTVLDALDQIA
jgi:uncharacterized membrane protein YagU involved in acid resistance